MSERYRSDAGFSMMELLVAVTIFMIISGVIMQGMLQMMTAQGTVNNRTAMHAGVRGATELLQQEVGQAGRISLPAAVTLVGTISSVGSQPVQVSSVAGMFVGEQLVIDAGDREETVTLTAVGTNTITAAFISVHDAGASVSVRGGFPSGIIPPAMANGSTANVLKIYGDINGDGNMLYVEYVCDANAGRLYRNSMAFTATTKPTPGIAQTLLDNLRPNPGAAPCFTYQQETVGADNYVLVVGITLTVRSRLRDPVTKQFQTQTIALLNVSPRNVFSTWQLASAGSLGRIQPMPQTVANLLP